LKTALHQDPHVRSEAVRTSIIIPYHNSPAELGDGLSALAHVNQPPAEYIVVDDGSDQDPTPVISRSGLPVRTIRLTTRSGAAATRNHGARAAAGEIPGFLDADVCVHHDTLALIEASFAEPDGPAAIIGSRGIRWTMLVLRDGSFPNVLNLDYRNRLSAALMCGAAGFAFSPRGPRSSKPANATERAHILKNFTD
jgi:glycosyltransferase involved in cell wall biosynthesis